MLVRRTSQLALLASLGLIVLSAPAAAERPSERQYGNHVNGEKPPSPPLDGDIGAPSGGLPFTGLEAGIVLLGGFAAVASGFALRRPSRREELGEELAPLSIEAAALNGSPPARTRRELARCATCGKEFDARGYQVILPGVSSAFDTIECAVASAERRLATGHA
jgi:hypothetical protein